MAVGNLDLPVMHPVKGVRIGVTEAAIRYKNRRDLTVFEIADGATVSAVFTQNSYCAAPVQLCREHLRKETPRYLVINTGNANAGTGTLGMENAKASCAALAKLAQLSPEQILPFSTGVIGEHLPVDRLSAALPSALQALNEDAWADAARGIERGPQLFDLLGLERRRVVRVIEAQHLYAVVDGPLHQPPADIGGELELERARTRQLDGLGDPEIPGRGNFEQRRAAILVVEQHAEAGPTVGHPARGLDRQNLEGGELFGRRPLHSLELAAVVDRERPERRDGAAPGRRPVDVVDGVVLAERPLRAAMRQEVR